VVALHDAIVWTFVTVNAARTLAYVPQIWSALRSQDGARGVSTITWGYFALSHFTGALYSVCIAHDPKLASAFFGNFIACGALLAVVLWRRWECLSSAPLATCAASSEGMVGDLAQSPLGERGDVVTPRSPIVR
jgi:hypothetical protein